MKINKLTLSLCHKTLIFALLLFLISACGGGGDQQSTDDNTHTITISADVDGNPFSGTLTIDTDDSVSQLNVSKIISLLNNAPPSLPMAVTDVFRLDTIAGCGGSLSGSDYITDVISSDCTINASFSFAPAAVSEPNLDYFDIKTFSFSWVDQAWASHYKLEENPDSNSGFSQLGEDIAPGEQAYEHGVALYQRVNARYLLQSCTRLDTTEFCKSSAVVAVDNAALSGAFGYFKASNTDAEDVFGQSVSLSGDGTTLAVGAYGEDSNAIGISGNQGDNSASFAGAVYVFTLNNGLWTQEAYLKASNNDVDDLFGWSVSLSSDGTTLAVGTYGEDSNTTGINGNEADNSLSAAGAVYVFTRNNGQWAQEAYLKASNTDTADRFGISVSLSGDGMTLAVGANGEASNTTGFNGNQVDNSEEFSGAVYVFTRNSGQWAQEAYLKASNTDEFDEFGWSVSLSADGTILAVGAHLEGSNATGIDGNQGDNSADNAGAVYVFTRNNGRWVQEAYLNANNTDFNDRFGWSLNLSADGTTLAVGANLEDSNAAGINGNEAVNINSGANSGAVYLY